MLIPINTIYTLFHDIKINFLCSEMIKVITIYKVKKNVSFNLFKTGYLYAHTPTHTHLSKKQNVYLIIKCHVL